MSDENKEDALGLDPQTATRGELLEALALTCRAIGKILPLAMATLDPDDPRPDLDDQAEFWSVMHDLLLYTDIPDSPWSDGGVAEVVDNFTEWAERIENEAIKALDQGEEAAPCACGCAEIESPGYQCPNCGHQELGEIH